jgi:purine-nucleoside phosphorylase
VNNTLTYPDAALFDAAADALPQVFRASPPQCALILGSGWSEALAPESILSRVSYSNIPGLGASTVAGHTGELLLLERAGVRTMAFCGRRHWYEGVGWTPVVLPVELARRMGATNLLITNAAGGISPNLRPGDLLLIRDHINTIGFNPLQGALRPGWGARFPDQSEVYNRALGNLLRQAAQAAGITLNDGVYAFTAGPAYETPAEIRAYAAMGADAVGMSTVPEAVVANAMGLRTAAVSCITNMAAGISGPHLNHVEVLEQTRRVRPIMARLLQAFLAALAKAER